MILGLQFLVDGLAFMGTGVATLAAGYALARVMRNMKARSELRDVLLSKHYKEYVKLRDLANKGVYSPEEINRLQAVLEQSVRRLNQEHRKLINEGLEQISPRGRAEYMRRILQKAEEKEAAHAGHA